MKGCATQGGYRKARITKPSERGAGGLPSLNRQMLSVQATIIERRRMDVGLEIQLRGKRRLESLGNQRSVLVRRCKPPISPKGAKCPSRGTQRVGATARGKQHEQAKHIGSPGAAANCQDDACCVSPGTQVASDCITFCWRAFACWSWWSWWSCPCRPHPRGRTTGLRRYLLGPSPVVKPWARWAAAVMLGRAAAAVDTRAGRQPMAGPGQQLRRRRECGGRRSDGQRGCAISIYRAPMAWRRGHWIPEPGTRRARRGDSGSSHEHGQSRARTEGEGAGAGVAPDTCGRTTAGGGNCEGDGRSGRGLSNRRKRAVPQAALPLAPRCWDSTGSERSGGRGGCGGAPPCVATKSGLILCRPACTPR